MKPGKLPRIDHSFKPNSIVVTQSSRHCVRYKTTSTASDNYNANLHSDKIASKESVETAVSNVELINYYIVDAAAK